ncbi:Subtilase family protein [Lachnospiraceae bacterium XBB1006]|nr:Subtilase family protein [Lachnospiraceae bacterium XBB1006]
MEYEFLVEKGENLALLPGEELLSRREITEKYEVAYVQTDAFAMGDLLSYPYEAMPKVYSLLGAGWEEAGCIASVQANPALNLTGDGVILGFIDNGLDLQDEQFQFVGGGLRVGILWNQETNRIYEKWQLESLPKEELEEIRDKDGHGSYVAAIAGGTAGGVAPGAEMAVVKLRSAREYLQRFYQIAKDTEVYQENDIMEAIAFLDNYAKKREKPLVLCFCLGTNQGEHDGGSYLARMMAAFMTREDRVVLCGAGNEALQRHHYWGRQNGMGRPEQIEIKVDEGVLGFYVETYVTAPQKLVVSVVSPTGERYAGVTTEEIVGEHTFRVEGTRLLQRVGTVTGYGVNRLVRTFFLVPTPGIWKLLATISSMTDGEVHSWLPLSSQGTGEVVFIHSDPDVTVVEPGNASLLLTTAAYDTVTEGIYIESGRGYTKSGYVKPDLAAPGVEIISPYKQRVNSSTSAATGVVSGAVALFMEWGMLRGERLRGVDIKDRLLLGARKKEAVVYPNREWGYGMLCLRDSIVRE